MLTQVIEGVLWRSSRPGYAGERGRSVDASEADTWTALAKERPPGGTTKVFGSG